MTLSTPLERPTGLNPRDERTGSRRMKNWNLSNPCKFVWIVLAFNAVVIGFYFSGINMLQQLIAPTFKFLQPHQWREFGILETVQHLLLLGSIIVLVKSALNRHQHSERLVMFLSAAVFTLLFLEELDYGLHYHQFLTGDISGVYTLSWHNKITDGVEHATILKRINDLAIVIWFVLIPLLMLIKPVRRALSRFPFIPSLWFMAGFVTAVICSKFAHYFDDLGYATIDGVPGNLTRTVSEFRETSIYYLYFLYVLELAKSNPLLWRPNPA